MPISADVLLERMKLKNQLQLWRGLAILAAVFLIWLTFDSPVEEFVGGDYIARISIEGFLMERPDLKKTFDDIAENDRIKAVMVYVDSPGGTVVGGESLHDYIAHLREKKPVVTVMGTLATSAAYMAVVPSDRIFARKGTITGSIGVLLESADVVDLAQKLGIDITVIKTSPLKGAPSPLEKVTPEVRESMKVVLDDFYNVFVDMVAQGRKLPREKVLKLADGRIYTGQQAVDNQLVDAIGSQDEAVHWLEQNKGLKKDLKVKDVELSPHKKGFDAIGGMLRNAKILDFSRFSFGGLLSVWQGGMM
jgi:protease-4